MVNYKDLLRQKCPIWVTIDCSSSFFWESLLELMSHPNFLSKCRFCILWETSCKLLEWWSIDTSTFGQFCCWEIGPSGWDPDEPDWTSPRKEPDTV